MRFAGARKARGFRGSRSGREPPRGPPGRGRRGGRAAAAAAPERLLVAEGREQDEAGEEHRQSRAQGVRGIEQPRGAEAVPGRPGNQERHDHPHGDARQDHEDRGHDHRERGPESPGRVRRGALAAAPAASAEEHPGEARQGRRAAHALPSAMPSIRAATTRPAATLALPKVSERMRIQTSSIARLAAPAAAAGAPRAAGIQGGRTAGSSSGVRLTLPRRAGAQGIEGAGVPRPGRPPRSRDRGRAARSEGLCGGYFFPPPNTLA